MPHRQFRINIGILVITIFVFLIAGSFLFSALEGWPLMDAFYFSVMTATTVGYGDYVPITQLGKIFTIIYSLSIVPFVLYVFAIVAKYNLDLIYKKVMHLERKQRTQATVLKEQEEEIELATKRLNAQRRKLSEQEKLNEEQEEDIEKQQRAISNQRRKLKAAQEELDVMEFELEERRRNNRKKKSKTAGGKKKKK